jgi:hypothetical protein
MPEFVPGCIFLAASLSFTLKTETFDSQYIGQYLGHYQQQHFEGLVRLVAQRLSGSEFTESTLGIVPSVL